MGSSLEQALKNAIKMRKRNRVKQELFTRNWEMFCSTPIACAIHMEPYLQKMVWIPKLLWKGSDIRTSRPPYRLTPSTQKSCSNSPSTCLKKQCPHRENAVEHSPDQFRVFSRFLWFSAQFYFSGGKWVANRLNHRMRIPKIRLISF